MKFTRKPLALAVASIMAVGGLYSGAAFADSTSDVQAKLNALQQQIETLKASLNQVQTTQAQAAAAPAAPSGGSFFERKNSDDITFLTRGGEVTVYGKLALSAQDVKSGLKPGFGGDGAYNTPVGNTSYMPAIGSDISYVGFKGFQKLDDSNMNFVYQLETQIDISSTSGTSNAINASDNTVKGGLTSRNSYIGLASPDWGAVKIGKTDAPYKTSTDRMNAFSGTLGDYAAIMGNTGGDNRVEFGSRLDHSLWYESPNFSGFRVNALFSPGQNRSLSNDNIAAGESGCTGGDNPQSGISYTGTYPSSCTDGSFGNAFSTNVSYENGPLYITGAYELHKDVNRDNDQVLATTDPSDIADETAAKVGIQYKFPTKTTVSYIFEKFTRNLPDPSSDVAGNWQNERARTGYWLALSQELTSKDSLHFGWAHANKAVGDPGVHNDGVTYAGIDNSANMYTAMYKHDVDKKLSLYTVLAETRNGQAAHFDLGAGGRSIATDCHDAGVGDLNYSGNGTCYAGNTILGIEVGMSYKF